MLDDRNDAPIPDPYISSEEAARAAPAAPTHDAPSPVSDAYVAAVHGVLGTPSIGAVRPSADPAGTPYPPHPAAFRAVPVSPYATWSLVVGIFGLICFGAGPILGAIAIGLGALGWRQASRPGIRGRVTAGLGLAAGIFSIVFFAGGVALYLSLARAPKTAANAPAAKDSAQDPPAAAAPNNKTQDPASSSQPVKPAEPPPTTSTVTTIGNITVVDVALGVASLANELRRQHAEATAHGERLLVQTNSSECLPCQGIASALSDPRMQTALDHVRLVRVDNEPFEEDLAELEIPSKPIPGFFLLDSDLRVTDGINGGEWDDDIATNIAPVLGPFVRGNYVKRRSPWKKLPRPGGTSL